MRLGKRARTIGAEKRMGPSAMDYSLAEKQAVQEAFEALLDAFDAEDREPDRWEEDCLSHALTAMACGLYRVAAVELHIFCTPPGART